MKRSIVLSIGIWIALASIGAAENQTIATPAFRADNAVGPSYVVIDHTKFEPGRYFFALVKAEDGTVRLQQIEHLITLTNGGGGDGPVGPDPGDDPDEPDWDALPQANRDKVIAELKFALRLCTNPTGNVTTDQVARALSMGLAQSLGNDAPAWKPLTEWLSAELDAENTLGGYSAILESVIDQLEP